MNVLTIGTFDLLHVGHIELIEACATLADGGKVIVGVNDSEFVTSFKAPPKRGNAQRLADVRALRHVDEAFIHYGRDFARDDIDLYAPDIIAVGDDWQDRDYLGQLGVTQGWLDTRGVRVVYVPRRTGVSSTALREVLRARSSCE